MDSARSEEDLSIYGVEAHRVIVRRPSYTLALTHVDAWVAVKAFADAAGAIRDRGDLSSLDARVPLDDWFGD